MILQRQRGELSLFWSAVLAALVAMAAMAILFSMRYERNFFAEGWSRLMHSPAGQAIQSTQSAAGAAVKPGSGEVRKCTVNGRVVYSNVECDTKNPSSRKVDLQDSRGFETAKTPAPEAPAGKTPPNLQDKMIERATR